MPILPDEIFELVPLLYPLFVFALDRSELSGPQFFALSSLKHSPVSLDGRPAMLISEMTWLLSKVGGYGPSRASMIIIELHRKELIDKMDINQQKREQLFSRSAVNLLSRSAVEQIGGRNKVVVIRSEGLAVLSAFNSHIDETVDELVRNSGMSKAAVLTGQKLLRRSATKLAAAARQRAKDHNDARGS